MNTERYEVSLRIQSERGKIRTRTKTPYLDTFHAVLDIMFRIAYGKLNLHGNMINSKNIMSLSLGTKFHFKQTITIFRTKFAQKNISGPKVCSSFSKELDVFSGVPQGSILGPALSNTDICDLFFIDISYDLANYANNTTPYECVPYYDKLKKNVEFSVYKVYNFFFYQCFLSQKFTNHSPAGERRGLSHNHFHPLYRY